MDFRQVLSEAGIPTDAAGLKAAWAQEVADQGSLIANDSAYSPFWQLLQALLTTPAQWTVDLLADELLPGMFLKTASGSWLDLHAFREGVVRLGASQAQGELTFSRLGTSGELSVSAGAVVASPEIEGVTYRVSTDAAATIPDGASSARIAVTAEAAGAAWNLAAGYYTVLETPVSGITSVTNEADWLLSPGVDPETDAELRERLRLQKQFNAKQKFHTFNSYKLILNETSSGAVDLDQVFADANQPRGPGSADLYIYTDSGLPAAALLTTLNEAVVTEGQHGVGDDIQVLSVPALPLDVQWQLTAPTTATAAEKTQLQTDADAIARAIFRETAAYADAPRVEPFRRVSLSEWMMALHAELGEAVQSVEVLQPTADVQPGLELPTLNSLVVSVL